MKALLVLAAVTLSLTATPAAAEDGPVNGPFSPTFNDSPIIVCAVPEACVFPPTERHSP